MRKIFTALVTFLALSSIAKEGVYLGILEKNGIRAAFEKSANEWKIRYIAVPDSAALKQAHLFYQKPNTWKIYFDGKMYGDVKTESFGPYPYYSNVGLQKISSPIPELKFRKMSREFANWVDEEALRPVLVSSVVAKDPEGWKRAPADEATLRIGIGQMIVELEHEVVFVKQNKARTKLPKRGFLREDFRVITNYTSKKGEALLALSFAPQKDQAQCGDDGSEDCDAYETRWFLKNKEGIKLIGKAAALVDTGDFDKDGRSEMIFALRRYNRDGYALYAPSEKNPWVEFSWNYH